MPQETKAHPDPNKSTLQGAIPPLATDDEIRAAFDQAFDYRGDITLTLKDGRRIEGYIFDRRSESRVLADCHVRLFPKDSDQKVSIAYSDVASLQFTGRDTAAGKSFETWLKNYHAKKAAGATNIRIDPEPLD